MILLINSLKKSSIGLMILAVMLISGQLIPNADAQLSSSPATTPTSCSQDFRTDGNDLLTELTEDLAEYGQNDLVTSEQVADIYARLQKYRADVRFLNQVYNQDAGRGSASSGVLLNLSCQQIAENLISNGESIANFYLNRTAKLKQSTALIEQYNQLLKNSDKLNTELSNLNSGFADFISRFPCYSESCVQN
ncbi:hypothetical protein KA036_01790 [Candidatus Gracilibacteria bacterium]|nr:hypothetical protein [Candidatus Gracilibacteria bacterium]